MRTASRRRSLEPDSQPRNVFLTQRADSGEPGPVKVIDFGLAKILDGQGSSRGSDGLLIGTPEYLAPEAWRGISSDIDARSDQWSLAVLTYRMLAGRLPFEMNSDTVMLAREILSATPCPLRQAVAELPAHVEAAVAQALAKDKERRFRSVLDFIRALHGLPPASTVQLRRDPATALLDYRECLTAASADYRDYRERPTAALPEYNERATVARLQLPGSTAMLVPAPLPTCAESTALLSAAAGVAQPQTSPSGPSLLAASSRTLPPSGRGRRRVPWRWVAAALVVLAAVTVRGLLLPHALLPSRAAASLPAALPGPAAPPPLAVAPAPQRPAPPAAETTQPVAAATDRAPGPPLALAIDGSGGCKPDARPRPVLRPRPRVHPARAPHPGAATAPNRPQASLAHPPAPGKPAAAVSARPMAASPAGRAAPPG